MQHILWTHFLILLSACRAVDIFSSVHWGTRVIYADQMWIRFNKTGRVWSASPLTWFLSLVDVFSCLKNIRKINSLTLSLVDSICFKNAMLVDDKFKKG